MNKTFIERLSVKSVARSVGLPLVCLLIGLCGGFLLCECVVPGWFQRLVSTFFTALTNPLDTVIGSVIGASIALLGVSLSNRAERRTRQIERQEAYRRGQLADPVIAFIDSLLELMDDAYWHKMDDQWPESIKQRMKAHRTKEGRAKARLLPLGGSELAASFDDLTDDFQAFRNCIDANDLEGADSRRATAHARVGKILVALSPQGPGDSS